DYYCCSYWTGSTWIF
nr:immunoglobulin light chain junction region [Macaca mulatta]